MGMIFGKTASGLMVPVRVDDNGKLYIVELPALPAGTNVIGDIGNVGSITTLPALPTGTNKIGNIGTVDSITTLPAISLAANQNVQARAHGWFSGAWQKDPIRPGISGVVREEVSNLDAAAGSNTLTGTAVPAGECWILQAASAININSGHGRDILYVISSAKNYVLTDQADAGAGLWTTWNGAVLLFPGEQVASQQTACLLHDDLYLRYMAQRVDTDQ